MKRFLSLFLALVFTIGICFSAPVTIKASAAVENEGFRFYLNDDGTAYELCQIYGKTGKVTIPETHNGLPVETIDIHQNWNESYDEITEIEFPDTLKEIEGFSGFNGLTKLEIPKGVEKIVGFSNCSGLTEVIIPADIKEIGEFSFCECLNLETVIFEGNIDKLGAGAFSNCPRLSNIEIKGNILELGRVVFTETAYYNNAENWTDNTGLYIGSGLFAIKGNPTEFVVKDGITAFAPCIFEGVEKLTLSDDLLLIPSYGLDGIKCETLEIPSSVKKIAADAVGMSGVGELTLILNEGLEEIGDYAFYYAGKLKEVKIPDSVKIIGKNAFQTERLEIGSGTQEIDYTILNNITELKISETSKLGLENIDGIIYKGTEVIGCLKGTTGAHVVRAGTTEIGDYAFKGSTITSITIPDSVTVIGEGAFSECTALENVKLPANLTELPIKLFFGCSGLKEIKIPEGITKIGASAFGYCSSITELVFPDSMVSMSHEIYRAEENAWEYVHNFEGCDKLEKISYGANYDGNDAWSSLQDITTLKEVSISDKNTNCFEKNGVIYTYSDYKGETAVVVITHAFNGEFVIPENMKTLWLEGVLLYDRPIQGYVVEEGNEFYSAENGVLYNKDKTELISYLNNEETFTIPDTVTRIRGSAFSGTQSLNEIVIPDSVTEIGGYAFSDCTNLEKVTMSKNVTSISNGTFSNCRNLTELPVTDSVTEIGDYAFYNCSGLVNVVIPEAVKRIGIYAFTENMNLASVALNKNIEEIGFQAFANCGKLATVTLDSEADILNIDRQVFSETAYYNNDANWYENGLYVGDYLFAVKGEVGNSFIFKKGVKNFGVVFSGNKNLTSITIPDSVIAFSDYAFADCTNLTSLTLGAKVDYFGEKVFGSRDSWSFSEVPQGLKVDVGENKKVIQNEALLCWKNKSLLADKSYEGIVKFPEGITKIPAGLFYNGKLSGVEFPEGLITIDRMAFSHCENLTEDVVLPDSVENMYDEVFSFCTKLKKVTLSENLRNKAVTENRSDDEYWCWFYQCTSLEEVIIPEGLNRISIGAFQGCTSLSNIEIPETVTSIGSNAFEQCNEIKNIVIPDSVTDIGSGAFQGCGNLQEIKLPKNLSRVSEKSFAGCAKLESVLLPVSTKEISESAFYGCVSLKSVTVPENITTIGEKALGYYNSAEVVSQQSYSLKNAVKTFFSSPKQYLSPNSDGDQKVEDFTIQGKKDSAAEQYARDNRFEFVYVEDHTCSGGTATCTQKAVCSICGEEYGELNSENHSNVVTLEAVAPTCTETGISEGSECTACGETVVAQEVVSSTGHTPVKGGTEKAHTICSVCKEPLSTEHKLTSKITTEPTCTKEGVETFTCECGYTYTKPVAAKGHDIVTDKAVAATCTETGLTEGSHCTRCDGVTVAQKEVSALGHTTSVINAKEATCTEDGYTGDTYCSTCKNSTAKGSVIKAKGHKEVTITGKSATCTATGLTDGKKCSVCGTVTKAQETIKATGHKEVVIPAVAPTFTTVGKTEGKKCSVCGTVTVAQKDVAKLTLATPTVTQKNTAKGIEVNWNTIENAESYIVYRSVLSGSNWSKWSAIKKGVTTTSYVDTTVKLGTKYKYTVRAVNGDVMSKYVGTTGSAYNVTPTVKVALASNGIKVSWSTAANATGYTVYRSQYNTKTKSWTKWASRGTAKANVTSWTDTKVTSGTQYKYTVRAINGKVLSSYNKTGVSTLYLAQPTVKIANASTGVKVSWNKVTGATGYTVYRSEYKNGAWTKWASRGTAKANKTSWTDTKVASGVQYKYTVRAINGKVASTYVSSNTLLYLAQPKATVKAVSNGINVGWTQSSGATGYTVYRMEYNTKTKKWSGWKKMGTAKSSKTNWTDKSAKKGVQYKYTVKAVNGKVASTYKASANVKR